jgi:hypothetical protein
MPEYPRTRTHGTRVPATGTDMKRIRYDFEKKKSSTRTRRTRLPAVSVPAYPPWVYPARTRGTRRQKSIAQEDVPNTNARRGVVPLWVLGIINSYITYRTK